MAKNVTTWSNNDVKPSSGWTKVARNSSQWANGITKAATTFAKVTRNSSAWFGTVAQNPYLYDSASIPYDSATYGYDYNPGVANQLNKKSSTRWSAT